MQELLKTVQIRVNDRIYAKDPDSSDLGRNIINESVEIIHEIGFDAFTFKKLAISLGTTESTVYRYFENKHRLLVYLTSWYWGWLEYKIVLGTSNLADPEEILQKIIAIISNPLSENQTHDLMSLEKLHNIIISESPKAFLTKLVETEVREGFFANFIRVNDRIIKVINEINPDYIHARTMASMLLDTVSNQWFLSLHFPSLTDVGMDNDRLAAFLTSITKRCLTS
ncbi:MAG: TetR/AcrR family transcriptional regulator [Cyclobacteriaceae bacterium]|nr:TetR/AcrR family transcriptional regulator [Cyclobacteriaceae bacterium]